MLTSLFDEPVSISGTYNAVERSGRRTVVVAADDAVLREALRDTLSRGGFHVIEADDGAEVMDYYALIARHPDRLPAPDLIVAEVQMTGVDGLTLFAQVRAQGHRTPFIMLAARDDATAYELAERLDASFVFEHPVSCDEICEAAESLVS